MAELTTAEQVERALDDDNSFVVEAGAGSGKTHTLVTTLHHLLRKHRARLMRDGQRIACITYTNTAKDQIQERIDDDPLVDVSTIHEFLWSLIQGFQHDLNAAVPLYNKDLKKPADLTAWHDGIAVDYSDRGRRLNEGRITHDDVIHLSHKLISERAKLVKIATDRFPYILVDEYQDTHPPVMDLLLNRLATAPNGGSIIGLFGDSMQKIYRHGVGAVENPILTRITKPENYRCSEPVIEVLNKIRPELPQTMAGERRDGEVHLFVQAGIPPGQQRLDAACERLASSGWDLEKTKFLMLTHRSIAGTLDYPNLFKIYDKRGMFGRDDLLEATEPFAQQFTQIEALYAAHTAKDYAGLVRLLGAEALRVTRHSDKAEISRAMGFVMECREEEHATIGKIIDLFDTKGLLAKPRKLREIEAAVTATDLDERGQRDAAFVEAVRATPYSEAIALARFRNEETPFTTQHGVKGDEFNNAVVVIDDGSWTQFDIGRMIAGTDHIPDRHDRSRNLFYVCCSRARNRLAVVFRTPLPDAALPIAKNWFSSGTIHY